MLNRLQWVSYCLGVRLAQVRLLLEEDGNPLLLSVPEAAAVVKYCSTSLKEYFPQFSSLARLNDLQAVQGSVIVDGLVLLADRWPESAAELNASADIPDEENPFVSLEDVIRQVLARDSKATSWHLLGLQMPDGDWRMGPKREFENLDRFRDWIVEERGNFAWVWNDEEELQRLLGETGVQLEQLFPSVAEGSKALWGEGGKLGPWHRIEDGMSVLRQLVDAGAAQTRVDEDVCVLSENNQRTRGAEVAEAIDRAELERLNEIKNRLDPESKYIGRSLRVLRVFEQIALYNRTPDTPVLLLGPTGVGKTHLAELIHRSSGRAGRFVREQATSVMGADESIIREHWLGYGRGSTVHGAGKKGRGGILQGCQNGTIFFDELHGTPTWFQRFLLQVLDGTPIQRPHGVAEPVVPQVRMIFASNRNLKQLEDEDEIAHDLLDRLKRWIVEIPPLASRREDLVLFVEAWCKGDKPDVQSLLALIRYDWPGNVRELHDVLNQARVRADADAERDSKARAGAEGGPDTQVKAAPKAGRSRRELHLRHLQLGDMSVIQEVQDLSKVEAERQVLQFLLEVFAGQGLQKGTGLQKRLAGFLGLKEPAISKMLARLGIDL